MIHGGTYLVQRPRRAAAELGYHEPVVRPLEAHEAAAYRALRLESLLLRPEFFGSTYAESVATPVLPFERFIRDQDSDHVMFGAFIDGKLCGICGFQREKRERARHRGELVHLYVAPPFARRGIGARLIAAVLDHAINELALLQVLLSVAGDNTAAISAYHSAGFREYGWLEQYFYSKGAGSAQMFMVYERI